MKDFIIIRKKPYNTKEGYYIIEHRLYYEKPKPLRTDYKPIWH